METGQASGAREQFTAAGTVAMACGFWPSERQTQAGARLVGGGMQRQQGFTHAPVATLGELIDRHAGTGKEHLPLGGEQFRKCLPGWALGPCGPGAAGSFDRGGPIVKSSRGPRLPAGR